MKVTYDLPEDLVREVKVRAAQQGRTVKDLMTEVLRVSFGLKLGPKVVNDDVESIIGHDELGLPYIKCAPDAPASKMTLEELLALEEQANEEDTLQRARLSR